MHTLTHACPNIRFYDARYLSEFKSVIPIKSLCDEFQGEFCDVCILDEPEHLNVAFCDPKPFSYLFSHVVGIMHTNYDAYLKGSVTGIVIAPLAFVMINLTTRFHCHKIVKLSDTLQIFAKEKECVVNVHGIRQDFLDEGSRRALDSIVRKDVAQSQSAPSDSNDKIYFCGKLLWAKGLDAMIGELCSITVSYPTECILQPHQYHSVLTTASRIHDLYFAY